MLAAIFADVEFWKEALPQLASGLAIVVTMATIYRWGRKAIEQKHADAMNEIKDDLGKRIDPLVTEVKDIRKDMADQTHAIAGNSKLIQEHLLGSTPHHNDD